MPWSRLIALVLDNDIDVAETADCSDESEGDLVKLEGISAVMKNK